jgi:hypothetical protein
VHRSFFTDYWISSVEPGVALEERGFDPVWGVEHSHIADSGRTRHPAMAIFPSAITT